MFIIVKITKLAQSNTITCIIVLVHHCFIFAIAILSVRPSVTRLMHARNGSRYRNWVCNVRLRNV